MRYFATNWFLFFVSLLPAAAAEAIAPLAKIVIVDGAVPNPLTSLPGRAAEGSKIMLGKALGNCIACHKVSELSSEPFHGELGPPLDGAADRWSEAQLRLIVVNAKAVFPDTVMPAFYRNEGLNRVRPEFAGTTILTAQQVEDVVAFLKTLK
jgi:L-cysteine S-thiosulfotransferase